MQGTGLCRSLQLICFVALSIGSQLVLALLHKTACDCSGLCCPLHSGCDVCACQQHLPVSLSVYRSMLAHRLRPASLPIKQLAGLLRQAFGAACARAHKWLWLRHLSVLLHARAKAPNLVVPMQSWPRHSNHCDTWLMSTEDLHAPECLSRSNVGRLQICAL